MTLVERIQALCSSRNTTLIGLEREIGLGRGTIRNWDKNSPSVDKVQKVADYFNVSVDRLLYGFDKEKFIAIVNIVRYKRSIKEFSEHTGIDEYYLNRLFSGLLYEQPPLDYVKKIAENNDNHWLVDDESLFNAAGYEFNSEEFDVDLLEGIPMELLHHYQAQGMSDSEMVTAYKEFRNAEQKDLMDMNFVAEETSPYEPETIAAHHDGEDWTEEELQDIEEFKELVKLRRQLRKNKE